MYIYIYIIYRYVHVDMYIHMYVHRHMFVCNFFKAKPEEDYKFILPGALAFDPGALSFLITWAVPELTPQRSDSRTPEFSENSCTDNLELGRCLVLSFPEL